MNLDDALDDLVRSDARLAALMAYGVLDTPPEPAFEGIVRLATQLCQTPVALVSLVDRDRQWFKAKVNFPTCETDLNRSVCKFALAEPDLLVIPDLTADPRTRANPLVTGEPFIRFYVGGPLRTPEGQVLGSLCVIDTKPRREGLTPEQQDNLRTLADQVIVQMQMRRAVQDRDAVVEHQRTKLRQARRLDVLAKASAALVAASDPATVLEPILADGASVLGFDWTFIYDVGPDGRHLRLTHAVNASGETRARLRHTPFGEPLCGVVAQTGRPLILDDVQGGIDPAYAPVRADGVTAYAGFPVISQGRLTAVISFASTRLAAFDAETVGFFETLARLMEVVYERVGGERALRMSESRFRALVTTGSSVFYRMSADWRDMHQLDGADFLAHTTAPSELWLDRYIDPADRPVVLGAITDAIRRRDTFECEHRVIRADGSFGWTLSRAIPILDDRGEIVEWFGTASDVTDRVEAEGRRAARLALGDRLRDLTTVPEMTRAAAEIVGTTLGVTRAGFGRVDAGIEHVDIEPGWTAPGVDGIEGRHRFDDFGDIRATLRRGEPLVIHDVRTDPRTADGPGPMLDLGIGALVNMPVQDRGRTVALFIVQDDRPHVWGRRRWRSCATSRTAWRLGSPG